MRTYNLDFLIAALVLLLIIFCHYKRQKTLDSMRDRIFRFTIAAAIADVSFDLLCTLLIEHTNGKTAELTRLSLTIFYLLQVLFPLALVCYMQALSTAEKEKRRRNRNLLSIVPAGMAVLVIVNYWEGVLFYFDSTGVYRQGPWYMLMYYYALVYAVVVAANSIVCRRYFSAENMIVIWEFLLLEGICAGIQAASGEYLMTGFGIALGILVLYLTIGNPEAYKDNMTGVFEKQYFRRWYSEQMAKGRAIHIIIVNIRCLKQVNKIFGNHEGDKLLIRITEEMCQISDKAELFRMSGKRFFLVTRTLTDYEQCRDRVQELFGRMFEVAGEKILFPAVICGLTHGETMHQVDTLLAYVDYMAALTADTEGTVLIQSNDKIMNGFIYEQEVEHFLNTAIEKDLFEVYYQPIYSIAEGDYVTLEALSRLHHPTLGYIPPEVFITLAEKNGQIAKIGQLQLRRVCRFILEQKETMQKIQNIKINLSPLELMKYGYSKTLIGIIREYGLPLSRFQFEITETVATEYSENLYQAAEVFLKGGIELCLDDFGSGYANLNTVLKLPFSSIKMDRSLLKGILDDPQVASFYRSIVEALQNMGYKIIAEGVETEKEAELLAKWGVDMIQGFYFSRPVDGHAIVELLKKAPSHQS